MELFIDNIKKKNKRIEITYHQVGLSAYIDTNIVPFFEYDINVENVPDSIAVIPFLCNLLPLCFVTDADIYVKELDKSFFECIKNYRNAYSELAPTINFNGRIHVEKIVENFYKVNKNCLLFSGGIDATSSLIVNEKSISDCITIWGADLSVSNTTGWNLMSESIRDTVKKIDKNWLFVKSNFRDYINEGSLGKLVEKSGDNWWHGFQHAIVLLGCIAPLAYIRKYKTIFIASSYTKEFRMLCASDPLTDNCFKIGNSSAKHDGFEYDRCQKIVNIVNYIKKSNISLNLHVCWETSTGKNCGQCEKCLRTYLNCLAVNCNPKLLGIETTLSMRKIRKFYLHKLIYDENIIQQINIIKKALNNNYGRVPKNLKWLVKLNPNKCNKRLYWKIKKVFGCFKHRIFRSK